MCVSYHTVLSNLRIIKIFLKMLRHTKNKASILLLGNSLYDHHINTIPSVCALADTDGWRRRVRTDLDVLKSIGTSNISLLFPPQNSFSPSHHDLISMTTSQHLWGSYLFCGENMFIPRVWMLYTLNLNSVICQIDFNKKSTNIESFISQKLKRNLK